ncbi:hypothetical protein PR048_018233 [Dryococelus australis]|uniref:Reverse transcriptase n=1 Tax=Dryococelus australis TaxID=614101 RepID=A0ABQ9HBP4_9NEOP|nr:hypothetical protein PR048_018233 [Dryococelus australis]
MDKHVPPLNKRVKRPPDPWLTQSITELRRKRGSTFRLFKRASKSSSMLVAQLFKTKLPAAAHMLPIIILSSLSNAFEYILHSQYINNNFACLSPYQSGFRAKHSFATALTQSVTDDVREKMNERKLTC